jgi:two-component system sensor histidine kinase UhpB
MFSTSRSGRDQLVSYGTFVLGYFLAVTLSEHVYGSVAFPSPFWLPDSVLLCALLLTPRTEWWLFLLAVYPLRLLAGAPAGTPSWFQLLTISNDAVKGIAGAWLLQRLIGRRVRLDTLTEFLVFLGVAAVLMPTLSALAAAPGRVSLGDSAWTAVYRWFLGDALAQVVVTPTILYWLWGSYRHHSARLGELLILLAGLGVASWLAFILVRGDYAPLLVYVPVPFLLWAAVRLRPFGAANAIALVALIAITGAALGTGMFSGAAESSVLSLQLFLLVMAIPLLSVAVLIAERQTLAERQRELNMQIVTAQEQERARIARELHDDLAQRMAILHLGLEHLGTSSTLSTDARVAVNDLVALSSEVVSAVRTLSHELHPSTLDVAGLDFAMRSLCREVERQHGLEIQYRSRHVPAKMDRDASICAFRITQEALHNVVKHSHATVAAVDLSREGERLVLCISDDGEGFDVNALKGHDGLGLVNIRERLDLIQGSLSIQSTPATGTRVRVEVPLSGATTEPHRESPAVA